MQKITSTKKRKCLICQDKQSKHTGKLCLIDTTNKCTELCGGDGQPDTSLLQEE